MGQQTVDQQEVPGAVDLQQAPAQVSVLQQPQQLGHATGLRLRTSLLDCGQCDALVWRSELTSLHLLFLTSRPLSSPSVFSSHFQVFVCLVVLLTTSVVVIVYLYVLPTIFSTYPAHWIVWHLCCGHWLLVMVVFHYYKATTTSPGHPPKVNDLPTLKTVTLISDTEQTYF